LRFAIPRRRNVNKQGLLFHKKRRQGNLADMKTYLDFVDAVSGEADLAARDQCAFCLTRGKELATFNLARDLREVDLPSRGRPWAMRLCPTCAEQYLRLFTAMPREEQSARPRKKKATAATAGKTR